MYCTIEDIRAEGIPPSQMSNTLAEKLIALASDYVDKVTGQWFEPRQKTIKLDGRGERVLRLPVFLISSEDVRVDDVSVNDFILYNRISPEDDRIYPKIYRKLRWPKGIQNIQIQGKWGYVEEDGTTPLLIKRAAVKLVLYNFPSLGDSEAQEEKNLQGKIKSEQTDGHQYTLFENASTTASSDSTLSTGDDEIDSILEYFTKPCFNVAVA